MIVHASAFALYLISVLLMSYTNASKNGSNLLFLVMNLVWICTLFSSQLLLVIIFNSLCTQKQQVVFDTKLYESLYSGQVRDFRVNKSSENVRKSSEDQNERSFSNASLQESERNSFASQLSRNDIDMMEDLDRMSSFLSGVYSTDANKNILNLLLTPVKLDSQESYLHLQEYYQSTHLENSNRGSRFIAAMD